MTKKQTALWLTGIVLVATIVRLINLKTSINFDEWVTIQFAKLPWPRVVHYLRFENTPPLFFLLARVWIRLGGLSETWLRLLPALFSITSLPLFYRLARWSLAPAAALFSTAVFALSAANIAESHELRAYTLVVLLAISFLVVFLRWTVTNARGDLLTTTIIAVAGLYAHLEFVLVLVAVQFVFWTSRLRLRWRSWTIATAAAGVAFAPWLWSILSPRASYLTAPVWMTHLSNTRLTQIGTWIASLYTLSSGRWAALAGAGSAVVILWSVLAWKLKLPPAQTTIARRLSRYLVLASLGIGLLLNVDTPKYFLVAFLGVYLLIGELWERTRLRWLATIAGSGLLLSIVLLVPLALVSPEEGWRTQATWLDQRMRPGDLILVHPFANAEPLRYYSHGPAQIRGLLPQRYRSNDHFADLLKYNYQQVVRTDTIESLGTDLRGVQRVWYLTRLSRQPGFFHPELPVNWFRQHGWQEQVILERKTGDPVVTLYTRTASPVTVSR